MEEHVTCLRVLQLEEVLPKGQSGICHVLVCQVPRECFGRGRNKGGDVICEDVVMVGTRGGALLVAQFLKASSDSVKNVSQRRGESTPPWGSPDEIAVSFPW